MTYKTAAPIFAAILIAFPCLAQQPSTPTPTPKFEVATIKPTARKDGAWRLQPTSDGYSGMDVSLLKLISEAYGIYDPKLLTGGPAWINEDKFDLEAKFDPAELPNWDNLTFQQRSRMLQPLLAERFHLKVHLEPREFPVFKMALAASGPKLTPTNSADVQKFLDSPNCLFLRSGSGFIQVQGCLVKDIVGTLRYATSRTVVDETGLNTRYSFELHWAPENAAPNSPEASYPSIFKALQQQLGLKLVPSTAMLNVLVVDSAEKPSDN